MTGDLSSHGRNANIAIDRNMKNTPQILASIHRKL